MQKKHDDFFRREPDKNLFHNLSWCTNTGNRRQNLVRTQISEYFREGEPNYTGNFKCISHFFPEFAHIRRHELRSHGLNFKYLRPRSIGETYLLFINSEIGAQFLIDSNYDVGLLTSSIFGQFKPDSPLLFVVEITDRIIRSSDERFHDSGNFIIFVDTLSIYRKFSHVFGPSPHNWSSAKLTKTKKFHDSKYFFLNGMLNTALSLEKTDPERSNPISRIGLARKMVEDDHLKPWLLFDNRCGVDLIIQKYINISDYNEFLSTLKMGSNQEHYEVPINDKHSYLIDGFCFLPMLPPIASIQNGRLWQLPSRRTIFVKIFATNGVVNLKILDMPKLPVQEIRQSEDNYCVYVQNLGSIAEVVYCAYNGKWILFKIRKDLNKASTEKDLRNHLLVNIDNVIVWELVGPRTTNK